eukprot:CAMPEP_0196809576 /NCGR_PEP_ID=MMETSP1362-20130617/9498_1 /TAXON_ID=163516 /ORGANISM="Leptocylindrus danicus, Strain CCMP1856" /LENGTH=581 /DNA_ID=CAMNT_0042184305 /DNA_START=151 /DNA_END=1896 /DNA_ORIENTATION=-
MPEGPEVRVLVDQLQPAVGMRLINFHFLSGRYVNKGPPVGFESFKKTMTNYENQIKPDDIPDGEPSLSSTDIVKHWNAKGKFIYIILDDGSHLAGENSDFCRSIWVTLGMTGRFLNDSHPKVENSRWRLEFLDTETMEKRTIYYHDTRNFGTLKFSLSAKELQDKLNSLGPDLLDDLTENKFADVAFQQNPQMNICKFLMNQQKIAGVGNYILAEGLYKARIDPYSTLGELNNKQICALYRALHETATKSYAAQGMTRRAGGSYRDADGNRGNFEFELECYGRQFTPSGEPVLRDTNGPHGRTIWYVESQLFKSRPNSDESNMKTPFHGDEKRNSNEDNTESYINKDESKLLSLSDCLVNEEWKNALTDYMSSPPFLALERFLESEWRSGMKVFPPKKDIFSALNLCPLDKVKVVIVGQDPYHGPGQSHGLAFSVRQSVPKPPSLKNIFREISDDIGIDIPTHGCLSSWAEQGVLLLNTVLTVRQGQANSHAKKGWEEFSDEIINILNQNENGVVFLLWGNQASMKGNSINEKVHTVIRSSHPSPLGATKTASPFLGSRCFSRANVALVEKGKTPIDWHIQ